VIAANYDQVVKYATAIRTGTASTEAILSRFTGNASHPAYQALLEIGRAQRTIFVARYLRDRDLQREIEEGLNVMESWNRANAVTSAATSSSTTKAPTPCATPASTTPTTRTRTNPSTSTGTPRLPRPPGCTPPLDQQFGDLGQLPKHRGL
jgi:hypothetical protein